MIQSVYPLRRRMGEVVGYTSLYLVGFFLLEGRRTEYLILDTELDAAIPFCPVFILPYLLWFVYLAVTVGWFVFRSDDEEYLSLSRSLAMGCTVFLVISALCPNAQQLRPLVGHGGGLWMELVRVLYAVDTPTNVFPSIHVFNSLVCCEGILGEKRLGESPFITSGAVVLTLLIIAATVLLKQHTVLDVAGGIVLWRLTSAFFYNRERCSTNADFYPKAEKS